MKPVYFFPFTHLDPDQAGTLDMFFYGIRVLNLAPQASPLVAEGADRGRIVPVSIDADTRQSLEAKVRSFMEWARIHQGNQRHLGALIREPPYFRGDSDVTAIQSQIRSGMAAPAPGEGDASRDPLLFLRLAELWDRDNAAIDDELLAIEKSNSVLFARLKGEKNVPPARPRDPRDPGTERTGERISAWCLAAERAKMFEPEAHCQVLATTSPAVLDYLIQDAPEVINGLDIDSIKVHEQGCANRAAWQRDFNNTLDDNYSDYPPSWADRAEECKCRSLSGYIRLCVFPDGSLNKRFNIPGRQVAVCLVGLNS